MAKIVDKMARDAMNKPARRIISKPKQKRIQIQVIQAQHLQQVQNDLKVESV